MEFSTALQSSMMESVEDFMQNYAGEDRASSLQAMEQALQSTLQAVGQSVLRGWVERQEAKYPADSLPCACGQVGRYERRRQAVTLTLQGRVSYRRAYYRCACGQGWCPLDERLGIEPGQMSAQLRDVATLLGVTDAFGSSATMLTALTGVTLSPNSLRSACHQRGAAEIEAEAALVARSQDLDAQGEQRRNPAKPERLYGSLDGFQGRFDDGWHEVKAGVWWTVDAKERTHPLRYYADTLPADQFSDLVWAHGFAVGAPVAADLVFIADGAPWIWNIVEQHFPNALQIVDFYHACGYLAQVASEAFADTPAAHAWFQTWRQALLEGCLSHVVQACKALTDQAPLAVAALRHYYAVNRTRLRYGRFRALGLQIGSGTMESCCKQLGTERLKITGARWSAQGGRLMVKARAAVLTQQLGPPPAPFQHVA